MKKELNYTSPQTSKTIFQLGINWKASMYWQLIPGNKTYILKNKLEPFKIGYPAYNLSEIGRIIPFGLFNEMKLIKLLSTYFKVQLGHDNWQTYASEVEARAQYLIYLFRNKIVTLHDFQKPDDRGADITIKAYSNKTVIPLIPENQTDVIQYALLQASLGRRCVFYHLTIKDITTLAKTMNKVMMKNGFRMYITRERKECLLKETLVLCETK